MEFERLDQGKGGEPLVELGKYEFRAGKGGDYLEHLEIWRRLAKNFQEQ